MEPGPLPPHERTWRHPSELAADHRAAVVTERPSSTARTFALLTGTAGVVLVGLAILALSPRAGSQPSSVSAAPTDHGRSVLTTLVAIRAREQPEDPPLVTPLDHGRLAVTPGGLLAAAPYDGDTVAVRLLDGRTALATVVSAGASGGLAIVRFVDDIHLESGDDGFEVAASVPDADDLVTVMMRVPRTVPLADVHELGAAAGTAVVNRKGQLVGICTDGHDGEPGDVIPIDDLFAVATTPPN